MSSGYPRALCGCCCCMHGSICCGILRIPLSKAPDPQDDGGAYSYGAGRASRLRRSLRIAAAAAAAVSSEQYPCLHHMAHIHTPPYVCRIYDDDRYLHLTCFTNAHTSLLTNEIDRQQYHMLHLSLSTMRTDERRTAGRVDIPTHPLMRVLEQDFCPHNGSGGDGGGRVGIGHCRPSITNRRSSSSLSADQKKRLLLRIGVTATSKDLLISS